jgi:hypothetical protein
LSEIAALIDKENILKDIKDPVCYKVEEQKEMF